VLLGDLLIREHGLAAGRKLRKLRRAAIAKALRGLSSWRPAVNITARYAPSRDFNGMFLDQGILFIHTDRAAVMPRSFGQLCW